MSSFSTGDNPFIAAASIHSAPVISSNGFDLSALLPQFLSLQKIASSRELEKKEENSQPSQSLTQIVGPLYMRKLFIGGLSHETDDEDLRRYFARWGHVLDAIVIRDAATRHSRGFGFITYASQEFAEKCLACKPHTVKGKTVDSKRAVPRELIGKVEAQNCVDEDVTYQNNRKVLLTGLQKAHTVLALREYFTSFGLLNQVELLKSPYEGFGCLVYDAAKTVESVISTNYGLHHINGLPVQASAFPDIDPGMSSADPVFSLPLIRPKSKDSITNSTSEDDDLLSQFL